MLPEGEAILTHLHSGATSFRVLSQGKFVQKFPEFSLHNKYWRSRVLKHEAKLRRYQKANGYLLFVNGCLLFVNGYLLFMDS
jgi:hypothetical protein